MKNFLRWVFWFVCMVLRFALIIFGWFVPIHIGINTPRTKDLNLWERYVENAWRNPTPYLRNILRQPLPEGHPNPDKLVRWSDEYPTQRFAVRRTVSGIFIEYWSLRRNDITKKRPYFEKRFGWKFVDDEPTFYPTFQFHKSQ